MACMRSPIRSLSGGMKVPVAHMYPRSSFADALVRTSCVPEAPKSVHWHPEGITAVRYFTVEPCAALPTRVLKGKPASAIKQADPESALPFQIPPEPEWTNEEADNIITYTAEPITANAIDDDYEHIDLIDELISDPYFPEYISPEQTVTYYYQTYLESTIDKILQGDFKSILDTDDKGDEDYIYD